MSEILRSRYQLLDLVQVAFILTDDHSKILYTNRYAKRLFGYVKHEMEGQRIRILFLDEDFTYFLPNIIYLALYENGFDGEALLKQKDGRRVFVHLYATSFKEKGETFLTFSFQEIQRLKNLEREKLEMEHWASLGMMVEEIAHQIRNPIAAIGGYTHRLQKESFSSPKSISYLDQILRETNRLETMIYRVEGYILMPRLTVQREKVQEVVEGALQKVSQEAIDKRVSLNIETGALKGEGISFFDKALMIQALSYILENSLEAISQRPLSKKRPTIKVALFEDEENIGISISDRGEGIAKKNLNYIFDPFFSTRPNRIGLGLSFVKRVVEGHGGRIQVESRLRRGTTVTLTFPKDRRRKVRRELISPKAELF